MPLQYLRGIAYRKRNETWQDKVKLRWVRNVFVRHGVARCPENTTSASLPWVDYDPGFRVCLFKVMTLRSWLLSGLSMLLFKRIILQPCSDKNFGMWNYFYGFNIHASFLCCLFQELLILQRADIQKNIWLVRFFFYGSAMRVRGLYIVFLKGNVSSNRLP